MKFRFRAQVDSPDENNFSNLTTHLYVLCVSLYSDRSEREERETDCVRVTLQCAMMLARLFPLHLKKRTNNPLARETTNRRDSNLCAIGLCYTAMWKKLWYSLYSFARTNLVLCRIHETQGWPQTVQTGKRRPPRRVEQRLSRAPAEVILFVIRSRFSLTSHKRMNARARTAGETSGYLDAPNANENFSLPPFFRSPHP